MNKHGTSAFAGSVMSVMLKFFECVGSHMELAGGGANWIAASVFYVP